MNIADILHDMEVSQVDLSRYVTVDVGTTVGETVDRLNQVERSCAFVLGGGDLAGVFTQRDVVMSVLGVDGACDRPIEEVMTPSPRWIHSTDSVADGMAVMTEMWVRSLAVVDDGKLVGNLSYYSVMKVVAELLTQKASRTESDLSAQHGLMFIDFTGLNTSPPVTLGSRDTVESAVHQMKVRGVGSIVVVNEREAIVGMLSEFDLQTKVACTGAVLAELPIEEVMTADPVTLSARSPIADAVARMAEHEMSHVALVGETGRPVGVATFRAVADYFESSLETLG